MIENVAGRRKSSIKNLVRGESTNLCSIVGSSLRYVLIIAIGCDEEGGKDATDNQDGNGGGSVARRRRHEVLVLGFVSFTHSAGCRDCYCWLNLYNAADVA